MNCHSKTIYSITHNTRPSTQRAFGLIEAVTALSILALVSSSVLVVISRSLAAAADSASRMHAFETAHENMEQLLVSYSVTETAESGICDKYPHISWQTAVETFYEPITNQMWVRAVCSAEYEDSKGENQTVELIHWLTNITRTQLLQILRKQEEQQQLWLADQIIETVEDAAEYVNADDATIEQWLANGMLTLEDGSFAKSNLDLYKRTEGKPTEQEQQLQVGSLDDLIKLMPENMSADNESVPDLQNQIDPSTGLTYGELEQMDINTIFELLKQQKEEKL